MIVAAAPLPADELTAGRYLALRRTAAGVTIAEAARAYAHHALEARVTELLIADVEADRVDLGEASLLRLRRAFAFDASIYLRLAEGGFTLPPICLGCGCSWDDPCAGSDGHGCAWSDAARTICTACTRPAR